MCKTVAHLQMDEIEFVAFSYQANKYQYSTESETGTHKQNRKNDNECEYFYWYRFFFRAFLQLWCWQNKKKKELQDSLIKYQWEKKSWSQRLVIISKNITRCVPCSIHNSHRSMLNAKLCLDARSLQISCSISLQFT